MLSLKEGEDFSALPITELPISAPERASRDTIQILNVIPVPHFIDEEAERQKESGLVQGLEIDWWPSPSHTSPRAPLLLPFSVP